MQKNVLSVAQSQIGVKESPANSNNVKYNTWYYGHKVNGADYPWCAVFIAWCFNQVRILSNIGGVENKAYCPSYVAWARKNGRWDRKASKGALVLFDWNGDGIADHIGIVESVKDSQTIITIEGNTGVGNDSNGGQVMRRTRKMSSVLGFIHVTIYEPTKTNTKAPSPTGTATVYVYGSHGTGANERWAVDPEKTVWVPKKYCKNYKKRG